MWKISSWVLLLASVSSMKQILHTFSWIFPVPVCKNNSIVSFPCTDTNNSFLIFLISARNPYTDSTFLCGAVPSGLVLLLWYEPLQKFMHLKVSVDILFSKHCNIKSSHPGQHLLHLLSLGRRCLKAGPSDLKTACGPQINVCLLSFRIYTCIFDVFI